MGETVNYVLGSGALEFIRENRMTHGLTLSKHIVSSEDFARGRITTNLPPGLTPERLNDFHAGGILPSPPSSQWFYIKNQDGSEKTVTPVPRDDAFLATAMARFVTASDSRVCIIEEPLATAPDLRRRGSNFRHRILGQEVYYVILREGSATIPNVIKKSHTAFSFFAVLSSVPDAQRLFGEYQLTMDHFEAIAAGMEEVFVGAYDGEGYLVWEKVPAEPRSET